MDAMKYDISPSESDVIDSTKTDCDALCVGRCIGLLARNVIGGSGDIQAVDRANGTRRLQEATEPVALGLPDLAEHAALRAAVRDARRGQRGVEVRIGVGPVSGDIPLRVLGYADILARVIRTDLTRVVPATSVELFSSEPKAGRAGLTNALCALTSLGAALRLSGVTVPINLEIANPVREVPNELAEGIPSDLLDWLRRAQKRSSSEADAVQYAAEHAGGSMFGDLCDESHAPLRITLGGSTEGRFWAVRRSVRRAALDHGWQLAPAAALVVKAVRVPWYHPERSEPVIVRTGLDRQNIARSLEQLREAANVRRGGNSGLTAELRATERVVRSLPEIGGSGGRSMGRPWEVLYSAAARPDLALEVAASAELSIGPRIRRDVYRWQTKH